MTYILMLVTTLALGLGAEAFIKAQYSKWGKVGISTYETGEQAARRMLDANGLQHVRIVPIAGTLTDNYNPSNCTLSLSEGVYNVRSVAATAIACHEAGHAIQHSLDYGPLKLRSAMVPAVNLASKSWAILFLIGLALNFFGLVYLAILLFAVAVVFHIVTLPVEFNASNRAYESVLASGIPSKEAAGVKKVLTAAAMTYVAATLSSILQLLYYVSLVRND